MIYVSSSCIQREKISQILEMYAESGIKNIELSGGTKYYPKIEEDLLFYKQKYNINYACHAYFPPNPQDFVVNLASCNDEIYEKSIAHYMNCIELLKKIDCSVLSVHAGFYIEILPKQIGKQLTDSIIYNKEEAIGRFCAAYKKIEEMAIKQGVVVYLENNVLNDSNYRKFHGKNHLMMTDFAGFEELRERIEFNLLLDLGHLHVSARTLQKDFQEQCALFLKYVKWIHISDNNGFVDEHKIVDENSNILKQLLKYDTNQIPITMETQGELKEVVRNYQMLQEKIK